MHTCCSSYAHVVPTRLLLQVATVSAVNEETTAHGSRLWLGNLVGSYVSYIDLDGRAAEGQGRQAQGHSTVGQESDHSMDKEL